MKTIKMSMVANIVVANLYFIRLYHRKYVAFQVNIKTTRTHFISDKEVDISKTESYWFSHQNCAGYQTRWLILVLSGPEVH